MVYGSNLIIYSDSAFVLRRDLVLSFRSNLMSGFEPTFVIKALTRGTKVRTN